MTEEQPVPPVKTFSASKTALELDIDVSRVLLLCRQKRLGYTLPKINGAWVITDAEIAEYRRIGPKKPGRPRKPRVRRLLRPEKDGNHKFTN